MPLHVRPVSRQSAAWQLSSLTRRWRGLLLSRVRAPKHSTFEFAFRLEPIVQVTARLFSAFEIDFEARRKSRLLRGPFSIIFQLQGFWFQLSAASSAC